jgi:hypothetical protein
MPKSPREKYSKVQLASVEGLGLGFKKSKIRIVLKLFYSESSVIILFLNLYRDAPLTPKITPTNKFIMQSYM